VANRIQLCDLSKGQRADIAERYCAIRHRNLRTGGKWLTPQEVLALAFASNILQLEID